MIYRPSDGGPAQVELADTTEADRKQLHRGARGTARGRGIELPPAGKLPPCCAETDDPPCDQHRQQGPRPGFRTAKPVRR